LSFAVNFRINFLPEKPIDKLKTSSWLFSDLDCKIRTGKQLFQENGLDYRKGLEMLGFGTK